MEHDSDDNDDDYGNKAAVLVRMQKFQTGVVVSKLVLRSHRVDGRAFATMLHISVSMTPLPPEVINLIPTTSTFNEEQCVSFCQTGELLREMHVSEFLKPTVTCS